MELLVKLSEELLSMSSLMDEIRSEIGVTYPADKEF